MRFELPREFINQLVRRALTEDIGDGDRTTAAVVEHSDSLRAVFVAREPLIVAGLPVVHEVYRQLGDSQAVQDAVSEGESVKAGDVIGTVDASARRILTGERVALNLLQRLSGIATLTRAFVDEVSGSDVRILDTRKTTPSLRIIEKYAVVVGGGVNHRFGLFDAIMVKDNHIAAAGSVAEALRRVRSETMEGIHVQIEVDTLDQMDEALAAGAAATLLDNMSIEEVRVAVERVNGRARLEVSGGVDFGNVRAYAFTGVDDISIGALTHSARAVDIGLDVLAWT